VAIVLSGIPARTQSILLPAGLRLHEVAAQRTRAHFRTMDWRVLAIEQDGPLVFLRLKHFDPRLIGWEEKQDALEFLLVELNDQGAVFLELDGPNPRWVVYRRRGPDRLVAYFTRGSEPEPDPGIFDLTRQ
jgi:hypothetical protein